MNNQIPGRNSNPANGGKDQASPDPSNTSNIGQKVEQGVIEIKEGISEQGSKWEDKTENNPTQKGGVSDKGENYLKNPSPEEKNSQDENE